MDDIGKRKDIIVSFLFISFNFHVIVKFNRFEKSYIKPVLNINTIMLLLNIYGYIAVFMSHKIN